MSEHGSGTQGPGAPGEGRAGGAREGMGTGAGMGASASGGYGAPGEPMIGGQAGAAAYAAQPPQGQGQGQGSAAGGPQAAWPGGPGAAGPQGQWGQAQPPQGYGQGAGGMPYYGMPGPAPHMPQGAPTGVGYAPPQAHWPQPGYYPYPYPPQPPMGPAAQAPDAAALHARGAGMAQLMEQMGGGSGLSGLVQMLNLDDKELWKGALVGAALVLLLTNESVQDSLFKTGVRARDAVKSGVDKLKTQAREAGAAKTAAGGEHE